MTTTASVPVGVQLYSLRAEAAEDFPAVLERLGSKGFVGVEFAGFNGLSSSDVGRALERAGLQVASAHVGLAEPDEFAAALDEHAAVGCTTAVIPAAFEPGFGDLEAVKGTADLINRANGIARERGMTLGYHNHYWELQPLDDGRPALLHFFEHVSPDVIAEVDIYWAQIGGSDPAEIVRELGERCRLLHVKDGPGDDRASANVAVGDGAIDTPAVLAAATSAQWHLIEFDRCDTDMFDAVERSYEYLVGNDLFARPVVNRLAVVGCGVISRTYGHTLGMFDWVELAACADVFPERAEERAEQWGARAMSVDAVLDDPDIDAIVNLTPPKMHADVDRAALAAGKSVFSEKPLGITFEEGAELVELAGEAGLRLGCAPDTFLGAGLQTCRAIIDRGDIGEPLAANAFMLSPGPERWHPSPGIFYERGAGPLFDMGPYYLTALVQLLGPARRITAMGRTARKQREITSEPLAGTMIDVEVPTHISSLVEFESGSTATLVTSFDVQASRYRCIEVYGSEATLSVPDPNSFGGPVSIKRPGDEEWTEVELLEPHLPQFRGIGFADMLWAQRTGRPHRASAELALHVLELMSAAILSAEQRHAVDLETTCDRARPLPIGLPENTYDD